MPWLPNIVSSVLLLAATTAGTAADLRSGPTSPVPPDPVSNEVAVRVSGAATEARRVVPVVAVGPELELIAMADDEVRSVRRVAGLFDRAGLELPDLVVRRSEDPAACGYHPGVHRRRDEVSEIVVCTSGSRFERIVVHELAHAWASFELGDANKSAFQQARGWEVWHDHENVAWRDNGTEQAAEVIAWGVYDRASALLIDHDGCLDLAASYRALTDLDHAHGLTAICERRVARVLS